MTPHFASVLWSNFCSASNHLNINEKIHWNGEVFNQTWPQLDYNCKLDLIRKVFTHLLLMCTGIHHRMYVID